MESGSLYAGERSEVQTMTHPSLRVIRDEHRAMSAMLRSIILLLAEHRRRNTFPDFSVLRAMLFYVDEFPERLHHTKESKLLFPKLRARTTEADAVLDRLERDHMRGERAIRYLEHDLLGFEMMGEGADGAVRREQFERSMKQYVDFYLEHMHVEETQVLPLAEKLLTADDWAELDAAFMKNRDPLTGYEPDDAYRPLFKKILNTLAAPIGLGPALEAMSVTGTAAPEVV
jgi:hemerythrin-like domain-containing protein